MEAFSIINLIVLIGSLIATAVLIMKMYQRAKESGERRFKEQKRSQAQRAKNSSHHKPVRFTQTSGMPHDGGVLQS